jgi:hypothetical protein
LSRLDSFIRRMQAQRHCLEAAGHLVAGLEGAVLELGLGNGRTYDHLRQILPGREIYAFDREVRAHPDCVPPGDHLFLGDLFETLPAAARRLGRRSALAHLDLGSGDEARNQALAKAIAAPLMPLLKTGAIVLSDQELSDAKLEPLGLPEGVKPGRYFIYRFRGA